MIDSKRIAKNTLFLYFRMLLIMGVTLYMSRVVLKALGEDDFGLYNVVGGIVMLFAFLNNSLGAATSRYLTYELGRKDYVRLNTIFNVALIVHIAIALIIILLAETVGLWLLYNKMTIPPDRLDASFWVYQISIVTMFVNLTQVPYNATIIAHENMTIYAYVGLIEAAAKLTIAYMIAISPIDRLVFYALLLCLLQVSIMIFYRIYCIRRYPESHIRLCRDRSLYREIFSYAGSDLIGQLSVMAQGQGLNMLLNIFFGPAVNAARGIAYQIQGAVTQFYYNFMTATKPQIIKSYAEGDTGGMWQLVERSSCFSFYLVWMICLPVFLETDTILSLWLGKYPDYTVSFTILILILCLIQTVKVPRTTIFHAMAKIFWSNITVGIVLCLAFPLAYVFLRLGYSPNSVFWASNITLALSEIVSIAVLRHFMKFSVSGYVTRVYLRCLLVAAVSFVVPYLIYDRFLDPGLLRLVVTCMVSIASVSLTSLFLGMDKGMRAKLYGIIRSKLPRKK